MQYRGFYSRLSVMAIVVVLAFSAVVVAPAWSQSADTDTRQGTPAGIGMQIAAVSATVPYFVGKGAFAIGGGIIGGLAYVFSGLNLETAKSIWIPSMYGTYLITPEHLTGDRPVRFLGVAADGEGEAASSYEPMSSPAYDDEPMSNPAP
ncbi:MAG: hypothetical protein OEY86_06280 [Nitrospira sp.]|nr:hypothetical protein [Nitrospira sp.]